MKNKKIKVLSLFSGIGAFEKALSNINIKYELVRFCEIDKYATESYCAIHNVNKNLNLGDISNISKDILENLKIDLIVGGSPCQDFSTSGKQKGSIWTCNNCNYEYNPLTIHYSSRSNCPICNSTNLEKTRSSLVVEMLKVIKTTKPKYVIYENVKNITSKRFQETFSLFLNELDEYGYNIHWEILNAKDFNIPQNRERVFVIATKKDLSKDIKILKKELIFNLSNFLEKNVDSSYYSNLNNNKYLYKQINNYIIKNKEIPFLFNAYNCKKITNICPTIITSCSSNAGRNSIVILESISKNISQSNNYNSSSLEYNISNYQTIKTYISNNYILNIQVENQNEIKTFQYKIRKLTESECFMLMGFSKNDLEICKKNNVPSSQLYKQAGNSIVVPILESIFKSLLS